ncbi:retrovirus-related pol polyprotein from transposon TNT 1-94 [Tanacetum coccineum]|uniref:Retrovirus-related pol polyprotein from transposon TNT 1-94 n=1 Tax=Tanacetum coccineum TaxID=301880 RepID=A0ABQ5BRC1_9ASTR
MPGPISSGLVPNPAPAIPYVPPTNKEAGDCVFQPMFDDLFEIPPCSENWYLGSLLLGSSSSSSSSSTEQSIKVNPFAPADPEPFVNVFATELSSEASSSRDISIAKPNHSTQPHEHLRKWTDSHPIDNIIRNPSRPVSIRKQLATNALWCFCNSILSKDKIHEFDRLDVWELVPPPDCAKIIALKWIYKVKLDEYGDVLKNKACVVAKGFRQEEGLDFEESSPTVARLEAIRIFLANAASKNMTVIQIGRDVLPFYMASLKRRRLCSANLKAFIDPDRPHYVYHLKKALYGLKQASRALRNDNSVKFSMSQDSPRV